MLLEARNLTKHFLVTEGILFSQQVGAVKAVDQINFTVAPGETFGLVGESGCGKSTTAKMILLLEKITSGSILFDGKSVESFSSQEVKQYRSQVQAVFQDPYSSLSPRMRVGGIIGEPLGANSRLGKPEIREKVAEALEVVGLGRDKARLYPHEFSGGQRQRIALARALVLRPRLVVLDEPVSALDVSIQAQIMNLLVDIQEKFGMAYLLIAHDLAVVKHMSDRTGVMYLGKIVETASSKNLYRNPLHPYTHALYSAALPADPNAQRDEIILSGEVPSPLNPPLGCNFHPRCPRAKAVCREDEPQLKDMGEGHLVACHSL